MDKKSQDRLIRHGFTLLEVRGKTLMERSSVNSDWRIRSHQLSVGASQREADRLVGAYLHMIKL